METVTRNEEKLQNGDEAEEALHSKLRSIFLATEVNSPTNSSHVCNGESDAPKLCNGAEPVCQWDEGEECSLEETERLLREHSGCGGAWRLFLSPVAGRGLAATRALSAGELVLRDPPLVLAPRATAKGGRPLCARCLRHRPEAALRACPAGCGMAVCSTQSDDCSPDGHLGECALLRQWGVRDVGGGESSARAQQEAALSRDPAGGTPAHTQQPAALNGASAGETSAHAQQQAELSREPGGEPTARAQQQAVLSRASAAVRCLALPEERRRLIAQLYAHPHPRHGWEVTDLATELRSAPAPAQVRFMRRACAVMDANAFEVSAGVRGLFPLSAMMNNACAPNTTHGFDAQHAMVVRAAVDIPEGAELTNSYTPLLWGTPARQRHLLLTKHFLCRCDRCKDPQEFGSLLSGLRCGCGGAAVSLAPLEAASAWRCLQCGRHMSAGRARATQAALGALLARVDTTTPEAVAAALRCPALARALLPSNHVAVELKSCLLWHYGHTLGYSWQELSEDQLSWKEAACRELLALLRQLRAGRTRLTGLLMLELSCTLEEKLRRLREQGQPGAAVQDQMERCLQEAASVFAGDVTAPPELWRRVAAAGLKLPTNECSDCPLGAPPAALTTVASNCCTSPHHLSCSHEIREAVTDRLL